MGNSLGGKKTTKVMKINGETMKLKTPIKAEEVLKDHPGHVLLESEAVKHYGTRAKPLDLHQNLEGKRLYFLVVLPDTPKKRNPRRVRSGINMSAKDRLESLMLSRRSSSDLSIMKQMSVAGAEGEDGEDGEDGGGLRVKMRLTKTELQKLMAESKDETEAAERIMKLCMAKANDGSSNNGDGDEGLMRKQEDDCRVVKTREKRVSFMPAKEGTSQIALVAS